MPLFTPLKTPIQVFSPNIRSTQLVNSIQMSDTRFWGPPGWQFQNWIACKHVPNPFANKFKQRIYAVLPFVLPCKYCRASLSQYIDEHPLTDEILVDRTAFMEWIYTIHNCVNDKLRKQGLLHTPNPSFEEVRDQIEAACVALEATGQQIPGWDFLYAIAHNLPTEDSPTLECMNICDEDHLNQLNKHYSVPYSERIDKLKEFWTLLPLILPSVDAGHRWMEAAMLEDLDTAFESPERMVEWLYNIHQAVERENGPSESLEELTARIASHSSKCGGSKRAVTCRRSRGSRSSRSAAKTRKHRS